MYNHFLGAAGAAVHSLVCTPYPQIWYRYWVTRYSAGGLRPCSVGGSCCPGRSNSHRGSDSGGCNGSGCHGYAGRHYAYPNTNTIRILGGIITPIVAAQAVIATVNERSGVVNLGAEGMMLIAAAAGFAVGFHTGSPVAGLAAGAAAGG